MPSLQEVVDQAFMQDEAEKAARAAAMRGLPLRPPLVERATVGPVDLTENVGGPTPERLARPRAEWEAPGEPEVVIPAVEGRRMLCGEPGCDWFIVSPNAQTAARTRRVHRKDHHGISGRAGRLVPEVRRRKISRGQRRAWKVAKAQAAAMVTAEAPEAAGEEATPEVVTP